MRRLVGRGIIFASLAALITCRDDDRPVQDPSLVNLLPSLRPPPESKPVPLADPTPIDNELGGGPGAGTTGRAPAAKPAAEPMTDAEIAAVTSAAILGQIEMAEVAKAKASSADVKSFAATVSAEHREMEAKAKAVTKKAKITPAANDASTGLEADGRVTLASLQKQKGNEFDRAYIDAQVKAHREVLALFDDRLLPNVENGRMKRLLSDLRAHVATHLAQALELQTRLDGQTPPPREPPLREE